MGAYQQMIADATGEKDPEMISEIEEGMRVMTGGILSNLTQREFFKLAQQIFQVIKLENA